MRGGNVENSNPKKKNLGTKKNSVEWKKQTNLLTTIGITIVAKLKQNK